MQQFQILIVEDEQSLAQTIALNLQLENYKTMLAVSGNKALEMFR